ncbi:MAG: GrpB family protein [Nocardioides sp.]|nr:GrpB family protein [Nocardioides sp.]
MISVVDYDPSWPHRFDALRDEYAEALTAAAIQIVSIEHAGSTAVPGLAARQVIDCDIVVRGKNAMVQTILAAAGPTDDERASIGANAVPSHDEVPR